MQFIFCQKVCYAIWWNICHHIKRDAIVVTPSHIARLFSSTFGVTQGAPRGGYGLGSPSSRTLFLYMLFRLLLFICQKNCFKQNVVELKCSNKCVPPSKIDIEARAIGLSNRDSDTDWLPLLHSP